MNRRLVVLKHWLTGPKYGVSVFDLCGYLFSPLGEQLAKRYIDRIDEEEEYWVVSYSMDPKRPLYFPKSAGISSLYQVTNEIFNPSCWHYYEIPETTVDENDVVVDCGAAEGLFAWKVANRAKAVYAIEPLPAFVESLNKTFNGYGNVEVIPKVLSDTTGTAQISDNGISSKVSVDSGNGPGIPMEPLDDMLKDIPVTYIKADLEGFEMTMLRGAKNLIRANKPKIAITTYHRSEDAKNITNFLLGLCPEYKIKYKGVTQYHKGPEVLHAYID